MCSCSDRFVEIVRSHLTLVVGLVQQANVGDLEAENSRCVGAFYWITRIPRYGPFVTWKKQKRCGSNSTNQPFVILGNNLGYDFCESLFDIIHSVSFFLVKWSSNPFAQCVTQLHVSEIRQKEKYRENWFPQL